MASREDHMACTPKAWETRSWAATRKGLRLSSFLPGPQTGGEFSMTVRSPTLVEVRSVVRPSSPGDGQPCGQALQVPEECPGVLGGGEFPAAPLISIHQGVVTSASTRPLSPGRALWASILPASRSLLLASPTDLEAWIPPARPAHPAVG